MDPTHPKTSLMKSIKIMFDVRDVVDDVQYAVDDGVRLLSVYTIVHIRIRPVAHSIHF